MALPERLAEPARVSRVMVVDDSAIARGLVSRWIAEEPGFELAGSIADGAQAVARARELEPDLVVLDLEMPVMSGLEALPKLIEACPGVRVVIASTLTQRGASAALRALELGAADCIGKPLNALGGADPYREELFRKLRALAPGTQAPAEDWRLRPLPAVLKRPDVLVAGASTGGPQALATFLAGLDRSWTAPILVVQHMPAAFTAALAENLGRATGRPSVEAADGMSLEAGRIHVGPGDFHLLVERAAAGPVLRLNREAPVNYCRPALDPLFGSAARVFGDRVLAAVLTGMGADGREGARAVADAGGVVLAQDKGSSVVWGMPGAVVRAGLAGAVGTVEALSAAANRLARGARP